MEKIVKICSVQECGRKHKAYGLCNYHYQKQNKTIKTKSKRINNPPEKCTIKECDKKYYGRGFCRKHYDRYIKYGDPLHVKQKQNHNRPKGCKIEGCNGKHEGLGYCHKHYRRFKKHGDPLTVKLDRHGMVNSSEFRIWTGIKTRCYNENFVHYDRYGGRGITMHRAWLDSFRKFYEDVGPRPSSIHQLDRIDNDGNYEPDNCRWVTPAENAQNKSNNVINAELVKKIRKEYASGGVTYRMLREKYGIKNIHPIITKKTWKNV
jgi:hypothetical protein